MRDLLFKNLTSDDRRRRIIASCEICDDQGVRSKIRRHFVCIIKEIKDSQIQKPSPYLYVLKEHNTGQQREKFFCRIKGSIFAVYEKRLFLIVYMHSLKIDVIPIPWDSIGYRE